MAEQAVEEGGFAGIDLATNDEKKRRSQALRQAAGRQQVGQIGAGFRSQRRNVRQQPGQALAGREITLA